MIVDQDEKRDHLSKEEQLGVIHHTVGNTYLYGMMNRHPQLKTQTVTIFERERINNATPKHIGEYFDTLEPLFKSHNYDPSVIANFDETMLQESKKRWKVIVTRDQKPAEAAKLEGFPHITLGVTIFADGGHLPPVLILPQQTLPIELTATELDRLIEIDITGQDSGWMTMQVFEKYCEKEIIPAFRRRLALLPTGARGLLVLDGHSSRGSAKAMEQFNQIHVDVVTFVSHTSHVCQPLDLIIFGKFKEGLGHLPTSTAKQSLPHQRKIMLETASRALYSALYGPDVRSAFERAGIVPLSRKRVLEHKSVQDVIDEPTPVESLPRHRSGLDINNVILSSPELITKLKETESKRHPKPLLVPPKPLLLPPHPLTSTTITFKPAPVSVKLVVPPPRPEKAPVPSPERPIPKVSSPVISTYNLRPVIPPSVKATPPKLKRQARASKPQAKSSRKTNSP